MSTEQNTSGNHLKTKTNTSSAQSQTRVRAVLITRLIAGVSLLATGYIHIEQYYVQDYRQVPTIGTLFLLNFIGGTVLGLYFLVPARVSIGRLGWLVDALAILGGWAMAATSLAALEVSEHTPLFGWMENGYRSAIVFAIVAEGVAVVVLSVLLAVAYRRRARRRPGRPTTPLVASSGSATE